MDPNYNAVYGISAIFTLLGLFTVLFTYFICQLGKTGDTSQADNLDNKGQLISNTNSKLFIGTKKQ